LQREQRAPFDKSGKPTACKHMVAVEVAGAIESVVGVPEGRSIEDYLLGEREWLRQFL